MIGIGGAHSGPGVVGEGNAAGGYGVVGQGGTAGGGGVFGRGSFSGGPGVVGEASLGSVGVVGFGGALSGTGVRGVGGGVGTDAHGNGVHGVATVAGGVGELAENTAGGVALKAVGRTQFSRSGALTVRAGSSRVTKTGVALTTASLILATLQQHRTGVYVQAAVPNVSQSSFTVYLNKAIASNTKVAWFVIN